MKKTFLLLAILVSAISSAQKEFVSGVAFYNNVLIKMETTFKVGHDEITMKTEGQELPPFYVVEVISNSIFDTEYGDLQIRFTISPTSGRTKGFKYDHIIQTTSSQPEVVPDAMYYCKSIE